MHPACLNAGLAFVSGVAPAFIVEMFPPRRMAWMSGAYGIAPAVFGGFTPAAVTAIIGRTGDPTSPMFLLLAANAVIVVLVLVSRETAFLRKPE